MHRLCGTAAIIWKQEKTGLALEILLQGQIFVMQIVPLKWTTFIKQLSLGQAYNK